MPKSFGVARAFTRCGALSALCIALVWPAASPRAEDKEAFVKLELGLASERSLSGEGPSLGPSVAVEFTAIEHQLEIEIGTATLFGHDRREWETALVFKKPFDLSPNWEFAPGLGPVWLHTIAEGRTTNAIGATAVAHFVYWPTRDRAYGFVFEPSYTYSFGSGHEQSLGFNVSLVIPLR